MCRLCDEALNNLYCFRRKCFSTQVKLKNATIPEKVFVKTVSSIVSDDDVDVVQPNDIKQIEVYRIIEEEEDHLQGETEPIDALEDVLNIKETEKNAIVGEEKNVVDKNEPLNVLNVPESQDNTSEQIDYYYFGSSIDYFGDDVEPIQEERKSKKTPTAAGNRHSRALYKYPCEYCGKLFEPAQLSFHLNLHFGIHFTHGPKTQ